MKIWVLVEKIGPPPGHKKNHPVHFDRVNFCLTVEEEGDEVGNKLVCSFWLQAKSLSKRVRKKPVKIGGSKFHLRKIYKQIYL